MFLMVMLAATPALANGKFSASFRGGLRAVDKVGERTRQKRDRYETASRSGFYQVAQRMCRVARGCQLVPGTTPTIVPFCGPSGSHQRGTLGGEAHVRCPSQDGRVH